MRSRPTTLVSVRDKLVGADRPTSRARGRRAGSDPGRVRSPRQVRGDLPAAGAEEAHEGQARAACMAAVPISVSRGICAGSQKLVTTKAPCADNGIVLPVSQTGFARDNGRTLGNGFIGDKTASGVLAAALVDSVSRAVVDCATSRRRRVCPARSSRGCVHGSRRTLNCRVRPPP